MKIIALFINVLVVVIVLKMFAPDLSESVLDLLTKLVGFATEMVDVLIESADQGFLQNGI